MDEGKEVKLDGKVQGEEGVADTRNDEIEGQTGRVGSQDNNMKKKGERRGLEIENGIRIGNQIIPNSEN